ncbi:signal recognition particle 9 kDa protein [Chiloscyllium punctatum]|uniref:signal recognition particle 9 kDa protein n=1 Tax=Chiloscyllium plagiosum TaxID=36176 RepID=UPI001CB7BA8F|nr:signal recognition particle 9 kDa protein [Chiloscyllium plagiosum]XP_060711538.1 signal recognition particle 9 kDa protein [Hemiscyllium ocellatum]
MTYIHNWEEFVKAAEKLCLTEPMKVRVVIKYRHCAGLLSMKVTDDVVCLQYKTDQAQDVKKFEKFQNQLMRLMVSRESRSNLMEMD